MLMGSPQSTQCSAGRPARAGPPSDFLGMWTCLERAIGASALPHRLHLDLQAHPHLKAERLAEVDAVLVALELTCRVRAAAVLVHHGDFLALEGAQSQRQRVSHPMQRELADDPGRLAVDEAREMALVGGR